MTQLTKLLTNLNDKPIPDIIINIFDYINDDTKICIILKKLRNIRMALNYNHGEPMHYTSKLPPCLLPSNYFIMEFKYVNYIRYATKIKERYPHITLKLHIRTYEQYTGIKRKFKINPYHLRQFDIVDFHGYVEDNILQEFFNPALYKDSVKRINYEGDYDDMMETDENGIAYMEDRHDIVINENLHSLNMTDCSNITIYGNVNKYILTECTNITIKKNADKIIARQCNNINMDTVNNLIIENETSNATANKAYTAVIDVCNNVKIGSCNSLNMRYADHIVANDVSTIQYEECTNVLINNHADIAHVPHYIAYFADTSSTTFVNNGIVETYEYVNDEPLHDYNETMIFENCPKLRKITSKDSNLIVKNCPKLEVLNADCSTSIYVENCPNLKVAYVQHAVSIFKKCPMLQYISQICRSITLSKCPNIKKMKFSNEMDYFNIIDTGMNISKKIKIVCHGDLSNLEHVILACRKAHSIIPYIKHNTKVQICERYKNEYDILQATIIKNFYD